MNYAEYVIAAYVVFVLFLVWDYVAPLVGVRKALRAARLRAKREQARRAPPGAP